MNDVLAGVVGGVTATLPMTAAMELWHGALPASQRHPLPPRRIEERVTKGAGVGAQLAERDDLALTMLLHFGFGGAAGGLYGAVADRLPGPAVAKGVTFGLGVWAVSYLCGLPALGLERSALREPVERNVLMIAAHVVWGAALGATFAKLRDGDRVRPVSRSDIRPRSLTRSTREGGRRFLSLVRRAGA
ncbi:MAG: DUF6789 family protein [Thermodesulfobacteriota bacterium]